MYSLFISYVMHELWHKIHCQSVVCRYLARTGLQLILGNALHGGQCESHRTLDNRHFLIGQALYVVETEAGAHLRHLRSHDPSACYQLLRSHPPNSADGLRHGAGNDHGCTWISTTRLAHGFTIG